MRRFALHVDLVLRVGDKTQGQARVPVQIPKSQKPIRTHPAVAVLMPVYPLVVGAPAKDIRAKRRPARQRRLQRQPKALGILRGDGDAVLRTAQAPSLLSQLARASGYRFSAHMDGAAEEVCP